MLLNPARVLVPAAAAVALVVAPVVAATPASAAPSSTTYVSPGGTDGASCGTSASPCLTVSKGVAQALASGASDMTVQVDAGTYHEKVAVGTVPAGAALHLVGAGASSTTIDAQQAGSVLTVVAGTLTLDRLTFTGGSSSNFGGGLVVGTNADMTVTDSAVTGNRALNFGGGIAAYGTLRLVRTTVSDNTAVNYGGGLSAQSKPVTVTDSTISGNTAPYGAGVYSMAATTLTGTTVSANTGTSASTNGSGIYSSTGTLTVDDSTVAGNLGTGSVLVGGGTATISGSTISAGGSAPLLTHTGAANTTVSASILSGGSVVCSGVFTDGGHDVTSDASCGWGTSQGSVASSVAGIGLQPLASNGSSGPKTMAIDAASSAHLLVPAASCAATDERGEPRPGGGNGVPACDAGAYELQYTPLTSIHVAPDGADTAGCGAEATPCLTVQRGITEARALPTTDVVVHVAAGTYTETVAVGTWPAGRSLTLDGAGASSTTIDADGAGAALTVGGGTVTARGLTITGANGMTTGGVRSGGDLTLDQVEVVHNTSDAGGGAYVSGGHLTITRSTFADDTGDLAGGGAVFVAPGAVVSVDRSTLTGNSGAGAAIFNQGGDVTVSASTLAGNGADALLAIGGGTTTVESSILSDSGCSTTVADGGHDLTSDDSCGFAAAGGSVVASVADIGLAPLGDFGGPTRTMPPQSFSPAAWPSSNRVPAGVAGCPASGSSSTDQRGVAQPQHGGCDVGAVELAPTTLQAVLVHGQLTATVAAAGGAPSDLPSPVGAVTFATPMHTLTGCEQVAVDASGHMACTPDDAPVGTLTATFESTNGFALSRDTVSGIASITVAPSSGSVAAGGSTTYTVTGFDGNGASVGDVTSYATFTISPDGGCRGDVCTPAKAGTHTVTADVDGVIATASLEATAAGGGSTSGSTPPASGGTAPSSGGPAVSPSALPRTGASVEVVPAGLLGLTLLLAGVVLTVAARRRRQA